jgi:hypothetical protein
MGYKPVKDIIQVESMDEELRNGIWSILSETAWHALEYTTPIDFSKKIWREYFKEPTDEAPSGDVSFNNQIRDYIFEEAEWFEVYDFIEFVVGNFPYTNIIEILIEQFNELFEKELSGYRFVNRKITPITTKEEIESIELALKNTNIIAPVKLHLNRAIELLSDKKTPDYRNSIKESISSIEAMSKIVAKNNKTTLGDALNTLKKEGKIDIHPSLIESFKKLYGFTSDASGIRHALMEKDNLDLEDAIYILVSCSAFINYLITKSDKAGIQLDR